jgi:hypothetical protein
MGLFWLGRLENGRPIAIYGLFISQQAGISRFSSFFTILLNQKNLIFVISVKNCVDWYKNIDPFVENNFFEIFSWDTLQGFPLDFLKKIFFIGYIRILHHLAQFLMEITNLILF